MRGSADRFLRLFERFRFRQLHQDNGPGGRLVEQDAEIASIGGVAGEGRELFQRPGKGKSGLRRLRNESPIRKGQRFFRRGGIHRGHQRRIIHEPGLFTNSSSGCRAAPTPSFPVGRSDAHQRHRLPHRSYPPPSPASWVRETERTPDGLRPSCRRSTPRRS